MPTTVRHELCSDLPSGVPAVWGRDEAGEMRVYMRPDLPPGLAEHLLALAADD